MGKFDFACRFETLEDGSPFITCRDLPELLTWPAEGETNEQWAEYGIKDCIEFRIKEGEVIPEATPAQDGEYVVKLSQEYVEKIIKHNSSSRVKLYRFCTG